MDRCGCRLRGMLRVFLGLRVWLALLARLALLLLVELKQRDRDVHEDEAEELFHKMYRRKSINSHTAGAVRTAPRTQPQKNAAVVSSMAEPFLKEDDQCRRLGDGELNDVPALIGL